MNIQITKQEEIDYQNMKNAINKASEITISEENNKLAGEILAIRIKYHLDKKSTFAEDLIRESKGGLS